MKRRSKHRNPNVINVLCVNLEGNIAGAEQSLLMLINMVPKAIKIYVACPVGTFADKLRNLGVKTCRLPSAPKRLNFFVTWLFYLTLANLRLFLIVFNLRPQIIHANSTKAVLVAVLTKAITGKKLVWHARDLECSKVLVRFCSYLSSKVIAVSKTVKDKLIGSGVKTEQIEVIYNGVAEDGYSTKVIDENRSSYTTFANIGQFVPWKKQLLFIEVAERLLKEDHKAQFILIGDDVFGRDNGYKKQLIDKIKNSPFSANVKVITWQDNLDSYWPQIDCLIHTADAEPFGRVIIEAMSREVPVVAAARCGPAEIITHGKTGLLFRPGDIEELLQAMKTISKNKKLAQNLAKNAKQHVISNFQARQMGRKITKVYKELLAA